MSAPNQITPPNRLAMFMMRSWYKKDKQMHDPVIKWLEGNPQASAGIVKFCNSMLQQKTLEAIEAAVSRRSLEVEVKINLHKATQSFYSRIPEAARANVTLEMVLTAIEMQLEDTGYEVEDHILSFEYTVPTEEEIALMKEEARQRKAAKAAAAQAAAQQAALEQAKAAAALEGPIDDEEDLLDDDEELEDDEGEEEEDEFADLDEDIEPEPEPEPVSMTPGVSAGQLHTNGNGVVRRVDSIEEGKISWTVTEGSGSTKVGSNGTTSYKSFIKWSKEILPTPVTA